MNRIAELLRGRAQQNALPHIHDNTPNFTKPSAALPTRHLVLDIYIGGRCPICQSAHSILEQLKRDLPNVKVNVIDLDIPNTPRPATVVAIPSILINGHLVATGTPELDELKRFIRSLN